MSDSTKGNLLSNSKRISKGKDCSSPSNLSKYKIFTNELKGKVLVDLKKEIIQYFKLLLTEDIMPSEMLVKKIDEFPLEIYNKTLLKILQKHEVNVENKTKNLTSWRKKIKAWIKADGKPETRGGLVIPVQAQPIFKEKVHEILDHLPFRSLPLLREKILIALKDILQTEDIDSNTCSKHWWFNYMRKNTDIKEKWESILLERTAEKGKKLTTKLQQGSESTDVDSLSDHNSSHNSEQPTSNQVFDDVAASFSFFPLEEEVQYSFSNQEEIYDYENEQRQKLLPFGNEAFSIDSPSYFLNSFYDRGFQFENQDDENSLL